MKKFKTISIRYSNIIVIKGIVLLDDTKNYIVYSSSGEISTWHLGKVYSKRKKKNILDLCLDSRHACPKIPEFDEYLQNIKRSDKSIISLSSKYYYIRPISGIGNLYYMTFRSINYKDESGQSLRGIKFSEDIRVNDTTSLWIIYDGSRLSVWEENQGTFREVKNLFINSHPILDKFMDHRAIWPVKKIEYLPLNETDQKRVDEMIKKRDKIIIERRIKDLYMFLDSNGFLDDLVRTCECSNNAYSNLIYYLLEFYKLQ